MQKISYAILLAAVLFSGCSNDTFTKSKDGTEYKIIRSGSGKKLRKGDFMEMSAIVKYKDSMLMNTYETGMPQFAPYDTTSFPPLYKEIFGNISVGDSVIIRMSTDSLIKRNESAPWMLKGQFITQCYTIQHVYKDQQQSDSAAKTHVALAKALGYKKTVATLKKNIATTWAPQMKTDEAVLKNYLSQKGINASRAEWGTYVNTINAGTGPKLNDSDIVLVNYTGRTLAMPDSVFDSNTDPKFNHLEPITVDMSKFSVISGWIDGLKMLNKGSKAVFYIPSSLAYGPTGREPQIKPNDNLVFDIDVVDIVTPEQHDSIMKVRQKEGMLKRQQLMEERKMKAALSKKDSLPTQKPSLKK